MVTSVSRESLLVREYVTYLRKKWELDPNELGRSPKPELSCFMHGEMNNLLRQLAYTEEPYGCWGELQVPLILEDLLNFILKEIVWAMNHGQERTLLPLWENRIVKCGEGVS